MLTPRKEPQPLKKMKIRYIPLLLAAAWAQAEVTQADRIAVLTPTQAHMSFPESTVHTDYIITALFKPDWLPKMKAQTSECLLGIQRDLPQPNQYAAVGLYLDKVVFALCEPGTSINKKSSVAEVSETMPSSTDLSTNPLYASAKAVAITMFYTEDPKKEDFVLISAYQQDGTFVDAYSAQLLTLFDDKPAIGAGMHDTILYNGSVFRGVDWSLDDAFQATHDVLSDTLPVPEPTAATFSMLALTGLAARRRR